MELINHYYRVTIVNLEVNYETETAVRCYWRMQNQCNDITLTVANQQTRAGWPVGGKNRGNRVN